jgi:alpha,alpha-trehalase
MRAHRLASAVPSAAVYNNSAILAAYHRHCKLPNEDSKAFVDRPLRQHPVHVLEAFEGLSANSPKSDFEEFFETYFAPDPDASAITCTPEDYTVLPPSYALSVGFPKRAREFSQGLKRVWLELCRVTPLPSPVSPSDRSSIIPLPHPFFIPGGRFRECYYWDTYWVVKGLLCCDMATSARHCTENLLSLVDRFGFVPNGNRVYYLNRSQPPTLAITVEAVLNHANEPDLVWLAKCVPALDQEYKQFIDSHAAMQYDKSITDPLCVYRADSTRPRPESWSEDAATAALSLSLSGESKEDYPAAPQVYAHLAAGAESGWDFSSRWFVHPEAGISSINTTDVVPVCLNSILVATEKALARFHLMLGHKADVERYARAAKARTRALNSVLWNREEKFWCDFNVKQGQSTGRLAASGIYPLWAQCWPDTWTWADANTFVDFFVNDSGLLLHGGVAATAFVSEEQWDYPNSWPPLVDFAVTGLENLERAFPKCGAGEVARNLAERTLLTMHTGWAASGAMHEKYDGSKIDGSRGNGGEYEPQLGFGWTNGVALDFMKRGFWPVELT